MTSTEAHQDVATVLPPADLVAITWDLADLLALPQACCVALQAETYSHETSSPTKLPNSMAALHNMQRMNTSTIALCSLDDIPSLVSPLQCQDHNPLFRKVLAELQNTRRTAHVVAPVRSGQPAGHAIIVLVAGQGPLTDTAIAAAAQVCCCWPCCTCMCYCST
jgi:hypothetical protein